MITAIDRIDAVLAGITKADIEALRPEFRCRIARALRRVADLADAPKTEAPKVGVLADLGDGHRTE